MENKKIRIFIDESGAFHSKDDKYFILGGIIVDSENSKGINRKYKKITLKHKLSILNLTIDESKKFELKSNNIKNINHQIKLIEDIDEYIEGKDSIMFTLSVNINEFKKRSSTANIISSENLRYNYFVKILLKKLIYKFDDYLDDKLIELIINCDQRPIKTIAYNSLQDYLNIEISMNYDSIANINVIYTDSKNNYLIQLADMIAGLKFKELNRSENLSSENLLDIEKMKKLHHFE